MTVNSPKSAPDFDPLAKAYRWMEYASFGSFLQRCRCHYLTECRYVQRALVLGDGDGRFTQQLLRENPTVRVDAVDASAKMLQALIRRSQAMNASTRVKAIHADIRLWSPDSIKYELVVTNFFLDCLTPPELDELIQRLASNITPETRWLVSEFAIPEKGLRRPLAHGLIRSLYFAFRLLTGLRVQKLPNHEQVFMRNGFQKLRSSHFLGGLLVSELWQAPQRAS